MLGAILIASTTDLAPFASRYASDRIGRKLTIRTLGIHLGTKLQVDLAGVSLANMPGASQPSMLEVGHAQAEIGLWSLISGTPQVNHLSVDGVELLLEHGAGDLANWKFAPPHPPGKPNASGRTVLPTLLDGHFKNIKIDVRTSSGAMLRTRVDDGAVGAAAADKPVSVLADGSYNGTPVHAAITLASSLALHGEAPTLPAEVTLTSGTTVLAFKGTATDPLGADGLKGQLVLKAPKPQELLAIAGLSGEINLPLTLGGKFSHAGGFWQLADGSGTLDGDTLQAAFEIQEGARRQPDKLKLDATFKQLDINALAPLYETTPGSSGGISLLVDPAPGTLLDAHIAVGHIVYRTIQAEEFDLKAKVGPGVVTVEQIALNIAGGSARSRFSITDRDNKAVIDFDGSLADVDAARMSKLLGWGTLPLGGPVTSRVSGTMTGATLAEARAVNRISAVVSMSGGTIDRNLVSLASTDVRLLFGGGKGSGTLSCLLAVLDLRDGQGTIAPLKIMTPDGTITGGGTYDLRHDEIDMTIGTQSATTSFFALDVPVRISGPVSDFTVRPAFGAAARRLTAIGDIAGLPPDMRSFAESSACAAQRPGQPK